MSGGGNGSPGCNAANSALRRLLIKLNLFAFADLISSRAVLLRREIQPTPDLRELMTDTGIFYGPVTTRVERPRRDGAAGGEAARDGTRHHAPRHEGTPAYGLIIRGVPRRASRSTVDGVFGTVKRLERGQTLVLIYDNVICYHNANNCRPPLSSR
jgi:hypothetical protein